MPRSSSSLTSTASSKNDAYWRPMNESSRTSATRFVAARREPARDHERLVLERAHLVVEHPLAARLLRSRPVDRRQLQLVGHRHARQRVVGDRGADHRDHVLVAERAERRRHRLRRAARVALRDLGDELDLGERRARGRRRDLVDRHLHRPARSRAVVGLGHVVENPDAHHAGGRYSGKRDGRSGGAQAVRPACRAGDGVH